MPETDIDMSGYMVEWVPKDRSGIRVRWGNDYELVGLSKAHQYSYRVRLVDEKTRLPYFCKSEFFTVEKGVDGFILKPVLLIGEGKDA